MSQTKLEKPIFVVGHPRSGTTLLATVLGRNSEVAMPPETQFFIEQAHHFGRRLQSIDIENMLINKRIADLGLNRDDVLTSFDETDGSLCAAFTTILDRFRAKAGKPRVGEKSPLHLKHAETLINWFPDAKILCIERNGVDVVASMMRMPWAHRKFAKHVFAWTDAITLARDLEQVYPQSFRRVSFERFTAAPEEETRIICDFCELTFEPAMLAAGAASTVPEWEQDWKEGASRQIEVQPSNGLAQLTPAQQAQLGALANNQLARSGYAIVPVRLPAKWIAWLKSWPYHPSVYPLLSKLKSRVWR